MLKLIGLYVSHISFFIINGLEGGGDTFEKISVLFRYAGVNYMLGEFPLGCI